MTVVGCRSNFTSRVSNHPRYKKTLTLIDHLSSTSHDLFHTQQTFFSCNVICTSDFPLLFDIDGYDHLLKKVIIVSINLRHEEC